MACKTCIESLAEGEILLKFVGEEPLRLETGVNFRTSVQLSNAGSATYMWSSEHPLNLAYRWLNDQGQIVELDGDRTAIQSPLEPGSNQIVVVHGRAPEVSGRYRLLVSLVLEGVHWACDISKYGWVSVSASAAAAPDWPEELNSSAGGKALRGAIAAEALKRLLADHPIEVRAIQAPIERADRISSVAPASSGSSQLTQRRPSWARRLRAWLRHLLGIPEMRGAVEALLQRSANHQEQLSQLAGQVTELSQSRQQVLSELNGIDRQLTETRILIAGLGTAAAEQGRALVRTEEEVRSLSNMISSIAEAVQRLPGVVAHETALTRNEITDELRAGAVEQIATLRQIAAWTEHFAEKVSGSDVVIELISTIREIREWARNAGDLRLVSQLDESIKQLTSQTDLAVARQLSSVDNLQFHAFAASTKLDALLWRETIPLTGHGLVLSRNRFGFLAIQEDDLAAITYYSGSELPEAGTVAVVEALLREGDTFLDVGANVGAYSLVAARIVGPCGKVIAVEPVTSTFRMLGVTVAINGIKEVVELHECALGADPGHAKVYVGSTSGHSTLLRSDDARKIEVEVKRGDAILGARKPHLIKIDVEGWELEVLEGLKPFVEASPSLALIIECSPVHIARKGLSFESWLERVRSLGKEIWIIEDDPPSLRPFSDAETIGSSGKNLLVSAHLPPTLRSLFK